VAAAGRKKVPKD